MWNKPAHMNAVADALYAAAALAVLAIAATQVARLPAFALREVRIAGELRHVTRGQVEDVVRRELRGSFFALDLAATRAAFERLPWVRGANVRRHWPARLDVALEEHVALARWAASALVNTHGEVFQAAYDGELPVFIGPEGAAREIAIQYRYFRRSLETLGETPVQVQVTPRRAWQVRLASGTTLALGRENVEARLARFVTVHGRTLGRLGRRIDYVDLRYANGFAVRIPELRRETAKRGRGAG
ncbi:MAG: FtsQ-type POTRA domain-containing protein [Betaproteobacteria bacterium]|nr:FtsQ-type POTRA domain-containing protein [Betaproteobacteria bacterium]